jgi:hypothetical protein
MTRSGALSGPTTQTSSSTVTRDVPAWWIHRTHAAELLPIRERLLGPEHPDTLATRDNLAYWTGQAGG